MCGIFALISSKPINDNSKFRKWALKCSQKIRHRGPDGTGYYQTKNVCFAHERLAIMDPEGGNQPLKNKDATLVLCVNGEIFNYKALKEKYNNYHYKTGSDCEPVLALYDHYYNKSSDLKLSHIEICEILGQLDGQFSFILHDTRSGQVLAARDPFGITQCYYGMSKEGYVMIASEMKALEDCTFVSVLPAGSYIYFNVENIELKPIHYFANTENGSWLNKETSINEPKFNYVIGDLMNSEKQEQLLIKIRESFEKAVVKRLMTDVPFGILLSGGLDSSLVASVAVKYIREHPEIYGENPVIHTFSIGDKDGTDLPYARIVADFLGTRHHEIPFTVDDGLNAIEDIIYYLETYDITTIRASTPHYLLSRKIQSHGIKMVLSGEGSDELLGGYLYFHNAPSDNEHQIECKQRVLDLGYFDCLRADKSTMSNGLEGRYPFLDTEFVNLCINIHKDVKTQNGIEKYILRKAFDINIYTDTGSASSSSNDENKRPVYLPAEVLWRQKEQFSDSVTYRWIDTLKATTDKEVMENYLTAYNHRQYLYPINTPHTTEAYYYRIAFERMFPNREKTVKYWLPNTRWSGVKSNDPSGRAQACHINSIL
jgi:asparagine synthase (glutamine-hydrolysing)